MQKNSKIYVSGHGGMLGSAMLKHLQSQGYTNIITRTHSELDLTQQADVEAFFEQERPEYIFHIAAKTGGVQVRLDAPADMLLDNIMITMNVIHSALKYNAKKLLYVASGLVYPADVQQPLKTESMELRGLGEANEAYALAKITGIKLCQYINKQYHRNFISCIPCNTYGTVKETDSQFIPATIKKFAEASDEIVIWGDGSPTREFMHSEDLADALIFLMQQYDSGDPINIGTGREYSISEVVNIFCQISGYCGRIKYDTAKPSGAARLLMDSSILKSMGWTPHISLEEGLRAEFEKYKASARKIGDQ